MVSVGIMFVRVVKPKFREAVLTGIQDPAFVLKRRVFVLRVNVNVSGARRR